MQEKSKGRTLPAPLRKKILGVALLKREGGFSTYLRVCWPPDGCWEHQRSLCRAPKASDTVKKLIKNFFWFCIKNWKWFSITYFTVLEAPAEASAGLPTFLQQSLIEVETPSPPQQQDPGYHITAFPHLSFFWGGRNICYPG